MSGTEVKESILEQKILQWKFQGFRTSVPEMGTVSHHTNILILLILIRANLSNSLWLMDAIVGSADFGP